MTMTTTRVVMTTRACRIRACNWRAIPPPFLVLHLFQSLLQPVGREPCPARTPPAHSARQPLVRERLASEFEGPEHFLLGGSSQSSVRTTSLGGQSISRCTAAQPGGMHSSSI